MILTSQQMFVIALLGVFIGLAVLIFAIMRAQDNDLECWQFFATKGADGKNYASPDKLIKLSGALIASWAVIRLSYEGHMEWTVFLSYLAFVAGPDAFGAWLKSRGPQ